MINVLYISHESKSIYGSGRSLYNMIRSLEGKIKAVVVVPKQGIAYDFFKSNGVKVYAVNYPLDITDKSMPERIVNFVPRLIRDLFMYSKTLREISTIAKREQIQIIHTNSSVVDIGYYLARRLDLPHVWHLREFQDKDFDFNPCYGWKRLKRHIKNSDATICITKAIQQHYDLEGQNNSFQIFNAVRSVKDVSLCLKKEKYFLLCGRLDRAKGCDTAVKAFATFSQTNKEYRLKFVGDISDEYKTYLLKLAKEGNIDSKIDFEGYQSDTKKYYEKATAFLMCSENEAMGRVTVEAMFYGCPVIGYNGGGTKEIIQDGESGLLFNTVEQCALRMQLILDADIVSNIVAKAQQEAKDCFSEERYGEKIFAIYSKLIEE